MPPDSGLSSSRSHVQTAKALLASGRAKDAADTARAALAALPEALEALQVFGVAALLLESPREAYPFLRLANAVTPDNPALESSLSVACRKLGNTAEAVRLAEQAVARDPDRVPYLRALAEALAAARAFARARDVYQRLLALPGAQAKDRSGYAVVLRRLDQHDDAIAVLRALLWEQPDDVKTLCELGRALVDANKGREAVDVYRTVLEFDETLIEPYINLANLYKNGANNRLAADICRRGLARHPNHPGLLNNFGMVLCAMGKVRASVESLNRAADLEKGVTGHIALSNAVFHCQYLDDISSDEVYQRHRGWARRYAAPVMPKGPEAEVWNTVPDPDRRLRIGYLSGDFRGHSCAFFLRALLTHHDRDRVEIAGYSTVRHPDLLTDWMKARMDIWRDIRSTSDAATAKLIRDDGIDILVDLSGHSAGNRLLTFARKPAPIQATWLGYPTTTGVETIDWRISDPWLTPKDTKERFAEGVHRLKRVSHCYTIDDDITPPVAQPPFLRNGHITFGSFNNYAKVSDACLRHWAQVLNAVPTSRLLLKSRYIEAPEVRRHVFERFAAAGGDVERVGMISGEEGPREHLERYGMIDIALDTFPYGGMTTTCEALVMGVPVVSVVGERTASRYGLSVLTAVGLGELAVSSGAAMADAARKLAEDRDRLAALRAGLRERVLASPLSDGPGFARAMETAYRDMWTQWCATQKRRSRA